MARRTGAGHVPWLAGMASSVLVLTGCGGSDGGAAGGGGTGTVTAPWADFCTGTFTRDTTILDPFKDPMFTARAGEEYLLADYTQARAEFVYLTHAGPETFDIEPDASGSFPFTSTCTPDTAVGYYAVFTDVTVYADEGLKTKICGLGAGTVLPVASGPRGYAAAGSGFSLNGPQTYQIFLDAFSAQCGGNTSGYVSVPQTQVFGTQTWLVPIIEIIGPR